MRFDPFDYPYGPPPHLVRHTLPEPIPRHLPLTVQFDMSRSFDRDITMDRMRESASPWLRDPNLLSVGGVGGGFRGR